MSVVCKMRCNVVPDVITEEAQTIQLGAVYEPDDGKKQLPENAIYGKYTPWGEFKAGIANPQAKEFFKPGKSYYVTFTEAPD
jgi:hypothetical protein